ncbi:NAD-dependent epimerase/dehydratase family protein [Streptomyces sp. NBC_00873]|uniref:NAD-dependent epimerase/dehydratase family protein n=1 Tax=unclassified Streptomyces TaxID=2593676 RepID=UPI00386627E7|nr:NAD-dependent epimerase/dehydratase family protein [Streptomyces sp. NBC_00873]WTA49100.1 NAD-dependent epimerase/dehydratase family protein [Streptomyces sp. NBC_00842]
MRPVRSRAVAPEAALRTGIRRFAQASTDEMHASIEQGAWTDRPLRPNSPYAGSTARDKGVVSMKVRRAVAGEPVTMGYAGTVRRDLLHVDDIARDRMDEPAGRHWLLGTGHGAVCTTIYERIAEDPERRKAPVPIHRDLGSIRCLRVRYRGLATVP